MGHANFSNLSNFFIRRLYAKGKLSIQEAATAMVKAGEEVRASEGGYLDEHSIKTSLELVLTHLRGRLDGVHPEQSDVVIEPILVTDEQRAVLAKWDNDPDNWAIVSTVDEDTRLLDSIQWRFAAGWRNKYPEIPYLANVTL